MTTRNAASKDIRAQKQLLRADILAKRDALSAPERASHSAQAATRLLGFALPSPHPPTKPLEVSAFLPIRSEIDLTAALAAFQARGHGLSLPAIINQDTLEFRRYRPGDPLAKAGYGTKAPGPGAPVVTPDVMLIPLSVFDRRGGRLGYGAGHYDRAIDRLAALGQEPFKIGCGFSCQEVAALPLEPHDWALDLVVTEREVIECRACEPPDGYR